MTRYLLAGAAALGMMTSAAMAQSSSSQMTATVGPPSGAPLAAGTSEVGVTAHPDGRLTMMDGSASRDGSGKTTQVINTTTSYPLTDLITTTKKTTQIDNGVATETVTTTQAYPPTRLHPVRAPVSQTTTTRTYVVGAK